MLIVQNKSGEDLTQKTDLNPLRKSKKFQKITPLAGASYEDFRSFVQRLYGVDC